MIGMIFGGYVLVGVFSVVFIIVIILLLWWWIVCGLIFFFFMCFGLWSVKCEMVSKFVFLIMKFSVKFWFIVLW